MAAFDHAPCFRVIRVCAGSLWLAAVLLGSARTSNIFAPSLAIGTGLGLDIALGMTAFSAALMRADDGLHHRHGDVGRPVC